MPLQIIILLNIVLTALTILVIVEAVIANLIAFGKGPSAYNPVVRTIRSIVNPMLEPFRRLLPPSRTGGLDLSPMLVIIVLSVVRSMLNGLH